MGQAQRLPGWSEHTTPGGRTGMLLLLDTRLSPLCKTPPPQQTPATHNKLRTHKITGRRKRQDSGGTGRPELCRTQDGHQGRVVCPGGPSLALGTCGLPAQGAFPLGCRHQQTAGAPEK